MRALLGLIGLIATAAVAAPLHGPIRVLDGDTIAAGKERIRISAIDAPELPGHCAKGRDCAPGDPFLSKANMQRLVEGPPAPVLTIVRLGKDHYGRTVGDVRTNGVSVSCEQLAGGFARYWPSYDKHRRIKRECRL